MPQPELLVLSGSSRGRVYPLTGEIITLGRAADNNIAFPSELRVSSHHACIRSHIGLFWLEDLNSTNGTFLQPPGGERFRLNPREPALLVDGAQIHLAMVVTLEVRGVIASQDEATRRALGQLQGFVEQCYRQLATLPPEARSEVRERLHRLEAEIRQAGSEADLVRLVAEQLTDLTRTVVCAPEDWLPPLPTELPDPDSPFRLPSLHNLFLSRLKPSVPGEEDKP